MKNIRVIAPVFVCLALCFFIFGCGNVVGGGGGSSGGGSSNPPEHISTVDNVIIEHTSLVLDQQGRPHISYYDKNNYDLKYAKWNGSTWEVTVIQSYESSAMKVGEYSSIAIDSNNRPIIAFRYSGTAESQVRIATLESTNWIISTVDTNSDINLGNYCSLKIDSQNHLYVAYLDAAMQIVKLASYEGSSWNIQTVTTGQGMISLALDEYDSPYICYFKSPNMVYCTYWNSGWVTAEIDPSVGDYSGGVRISIALTGTMHPIISYYQSVQGDLKVASYEGTGPTGWATYEVDSYQDAGRYSSIAVNGGMIGVSYSRNNGSLDYAKCTSSGWTSEAIDDNGGAGSVGRFNNLALDAYGKARICYANEMSGSQSLKYYWE
jgi:hypothetical protein